MGDVRGGGEEWLYCELTVAGVTTSSYIWPLQEESEHAVTSPAGT